MLAAVYGMLAEYDAACPVERPAKHRLWADFCTGALRDALPRLCASAADAVRKELGTQLDAARSEVTRLQTECVTGAAELATLRNEAGERRPTLEHDYARIARSLCLGSSARRRAVQAAQS